MAHGLNAMQYETRLGGGWLGNFDSPLYRQAVEKTRQYILAGDVFQVNLSQRLLCPERCAASELVLRLRKVNAAPFAGYLDLGDSQIVSASPERFIQVRDRWIETRPIKGTRRRTGDSEQDARLKEELSLSEKDRSENIMIVDLLRNELEYASGGHPPAFLRSVNGTIRELPSTAFVLGACADEDFQPDPAVHHFGPGDGVIAYTDGALEARDRAGRMLGTQGLLRVVASLSECSSPVSSDWAGHILRAVESFRYGPPADDTLVVQIARSMDPASHGTRAMKSGVAMDLGRSRVDIQPLMPEREDAL
jgi:hypothetical protein